MTLSAAIGRLDDLRRQNLAFVQTIAEDAIAWASRTYGDRLVYTCSFGDAVMIDLIARTAPRTEIVLIDTQYLFAETWDYVETLRQRYHFNLRIVTPDIEPDERWRTDVESCCHARKALPLNQALAGREAWLSGVRRADGPSRATAPIVSHDQSRGIVKINPIANWSDEEVADYVVVHDLPEHPLTSQGYPSIGCAPCTRPVAEGDDPRSGRWAGQDKTECGLHLPPTSVPVTVGTAR